MKHVRLTSTFFVLLVLTLVAGCIGIAGCAAHSDSAGGSRSAKTGDSDVSRFFGKYVLRQSTWLSSTAPSETAIHSLPDLESEAAISKDLFAIGGIVVLHPKYRLKSYPILVEGDVAIGTRRLFSDFYGIGKDRDKITALEVYEGTEDAPRFLVEVVGEGVVWSLYDDYLLEWHRE